MLKQKGTVMEPGSGTISPETSQSAIGRLPELIIVADDNEDIPDCVRGLLSKKYRVHTSSSGTDALKATRDLNADLIILSVVLPGIDGFGLIRAFRADPLTKLKPIILVSSRVGEESLLEGLEAGADDLLVKPFTERELLVRAETHLKLARFRSEAAEMEYRLRAELEVERNRFRDAFSQAPAPMVMVSGPDHKFAFVNDAYTKLVKRDRTQLIGKSARQVFPELEPQGYFDLLEKVYQTGEPAIGTEREVRLSLWGKETTLFLDFIYLPIRNSVGQVEGILFQCVEVTDRVVSRTLLERNVRERTGQLRKAHENLRTLNQNLMRAQDDERHRLALELHDGAGQFLVALKWKLGPLPQEIREHFPEAGQAVADSMKLVEDLTEELRALAHLLHPPIVDAAGLPSALRLYVEGIAESSGLVVELRIDPNLPRLSHEVETAMFRIVQEALTNVHKHADVKVAVVRIDQVLHAIRLEIQDEGHGIPGFESLDQPNVRLGIGLQGMRERVQQLSGIFEVISGRSGTTVTATLPTFLRSEVEAAKTRGSS
jgi:PAS domain S-box-containing protein